MRKVKNLILFSITLSFFYMPLQVQSANSILEPKKSQNNSSLTILNSVANLKFSILKQINNKKELLNQTSSLREKRLLEKQLRYLDEQLNEVNKEFEKIATGIDINLFYGQKEKEFDWKEEIIALIKPGITELKRLTEKPRQRSKLENEINEYQNLVPMAREAVTNISSLLEISVNKTTIAHLVKLKNEWNQVKEQLENKEKLARLKIEQMDSEKKSLMKSAQDSIGVFFKTKGVFILKAIIVSLTFILILNLIHKLIKKYVPGYSSEKKAFHIKAFELGFRIFTVLVATFSIVFVFYSAQDWTLLSFAIIFILGFGWAVKHTIPTIWTQSRLMLNLGAVREGERIYYLSVPWLVKDINFYSTIENPDLEIQLRLPVAKLMNMTSRPIHRNESWFPCKKNDWVILSDGTRGKVQNLSHEFIDLQIRGGALKTYTTKNFIGKNPLNISKNFRIWVEFALVHDLKNAVTGKIPDIITQSICSRINKEKFSHLFLSVKTQIKSMEEYSFKLVIIGDFSGQAAPLYDFFHRKILEYCIEIAVENDWEIPKPQLQVYRDS